MSDDDERKSGDDNEIDEETLIAYHTAEDISSELLKQKLEEPEALTFTYFSDFPIVSAVEIPMEIDKANELEVIPMEEEVASESESLDSTKTDSESDDNSDREKTSNELMTWPGKLDSIIYRFAEDFTIVRCMMSKTTRKVYTVIRKCDKKPFVIIVALDPVARLVAKNVPREVRLMYRLRNQKYLGQILGWCSVDKRRYCILTEYYENSDIVTSCHGNLYLISKVMKCLLEGVRNMHNNRIVHRDLAKDNVLYNPITETATIIDFDTAVPMRDKYYRDVGRVKYDSFEKSACAAQRKELWKEKRKAKAAKKTVKKQRCIFYTSKADLYSLGIIFYMLLMEEVHAPTAEELKRWIKRILKKRKHYRHSELALLIKLVSSDPLQRISIAEALEHPFIKEPPAMDSSYKATKKYLFKMMDLDVPADALTSDDEEDAEDQRYASDSGDEEEMQEDNDDEIKTEDKSDEEECAF